MRHPSIFVWRVPFSRSLATRTARVWCAAIAAIAAGCTSEVTNASTEAPAAAKAAALPERLGLGKIASSMQLAAVDIDANPAGIGLPPGRGTYAEGATLYAQRCASCHGNNGQGQAPFPRLVGAEPREQFPFAADVKLEKTIGNYWPYATTLYDYIHRTMPYNAPGSLTPSETYALVAYLLAENRVIAQTTDIDAKSLPRIRMPAHDRFVPDDRTGGATFR